MEIFVKRFLKDLLESFLNTSEEYLEELVEEFLNDLQELIPKGFLEKFPDELQEEFTEKL